ncbi:hypothetical protein Tco_0312020 [Tanacetum coccineum]
MSALEREMLDIISAKSNSTSVITVQRKLALPRLTYSGYLDNLDGQKSSGIRLLVSISISLDTQRPSNGSF